MPTLPKHASDKAKDKVASVEPRDLPDNASETSVGVVELGERPHQPPEPPADDVFDFAETGAPDCSWGELTSQAIADGFDQGAHASDPSGDGVGPGLQEGARVGLANVVEQGDLHATCELIHDLLYA